MNERPAIYFMYPNNSIAGTLYMDTFEFEGDVSISAKIFFDNVKVHGQSYLNYIKVMEQENKRLRNRIEVLEEYIRNE